ncbi:MAG: ABC transporter permease subunit [Romboutsia sp.]
MKRFPKIFVSIILTILFLPILLTFIYSIATNWHSTVIPEGITFKWYSELFNDKSFLDALIRTVFISSSTVLLSISVMLPTVYIIVVYFPKFERLMQSIVLLPYAIPGVICSVGLIQIYSNPPFLLSGTIWLLMGAYFIIILPFMYQGIRNSLRNINVIELIQAAEILGASKTKAFIKVIVPNILSGILVSSLLSFSILFGEFVMTNFLIGGRFETVQIYLKRLMDNSGHLSSAIVISYFIFILVITTISIKISKSPKSYDKKYVYISSIDKINKLKKSRIESKEAI